MAQLLKINGHMPNLNTDSAGLSLDPDLSYSFDFDEVSFATNARAQFNSKHIKLLRLLFGNYHLKQISRVENIENMLSDIREIIEKLFNNHLHQARL